MSLQIYLSTFLLIAQGCSVFAQCRVEYMSQPATLSTTSYIQPTGQFVIPAVIKPLIDTIAQPPIVPSFTDFNTCNYPTYPTPMPPICVSRNDDDDWRRILYCLIFALSNRLGNGDCSCGGACGCGGNCGFGGNYGCGGGFGNGCGCGGGCGYGGNLGFVGGCGGGCSCGGNCGFGGNCGNGNGCSCGNGFGFGGNCGCGGNCGFGGSCGCNRGCGNCGFDGGICGCGYPNGCGCNDYSFGNGITYIPYPIIIPTNGASPCGMSYDPNVNSDPYNGPCCQGPTLQASNGKDTNEINLRIITDSC